jgi:hypothetical protein
VRWDGTDATTVQDGQTTENDDGDVTIVGTVRATGYNVPTAGAGLELGYSSNTALMIAYDRGNTLWRAMSVRSSEYTVNISGVDIHTTNGTGLVLASGKTLTSADEDTAHTFGRLLVGSVGAADFAAVAHRDFASTTGYMLGQNASGDTSVNSETGRATRLRIGNALVASVFSTGLDFESGKGVSFNGGDVLGSYTDPGLTSQFTPTGNGIIYTAAFATEGNIGGLWVGRFDIQFPTTPDPSQAQVSGWSFTAESNDFRGWGGVITSANFTPGTKVRFSGGVMIFENAAGNAILTNADLSGKRLRGFYMVAEA